jgi:hypothetical protein
MGRYALALVGACAACTSLAGLATTDVDGGTADGAQAEGGAEAGTPESQSSVDVAEASACTPNPPSAAPPFHEPGPHTSSCNSLQISNFYSVCVVGGNTTACQTLVAAAAACAGCLLSTASADPSRAIVFDGTWRVVNVGGCFKLVSDAGAIVATCAEVVQKREMCAAMACQGCRDGNPEDPEHVACMKAAYDVVPCKSDAAVACISGAGGACGAGRSFAEQYQAVAAVFCQ